jgi:hypothetical protein
MRCQIYSFGLAVLLVISGASAAPVYQPPGANLTYGDVTHGQRVTSAMGNPAAAAANLERAGEKGAGGMALSVTAGIEYGGVQELFDAIDQLSEAFKPSDDPPVEPPPPGQDPGDKPDDGIDIGHIIDQLDPDLVAAVEAIAKEVAVSAALLAVIAVDGYAKAFVSGDLPVVIGKEILGGAWTFGVNWSGTSKAFGVADDIDFDKQQVLDFLENTLGNGPLNLPRKVNLPGDTEISIGQFGRVLLVLENDSLMLTKAATTAEFSAGYSRRVWPTARGSLYLGGEGKLYQMRLSRIDVRLGDITDSDEVFDAIRRDDYRTDTGFGLDIGALWVSDIYQLGATLTNANEPAFIFPAADESIYNDVDIINFLRRDQVYTMERQLRLESSVFTPNRRWTMNLGMDANAVPDPMGDDFQWLSVSGGYATDSWWIPGVRVGYRRNLAGTELSYLGVGVTAFKVLNIDVASSLDTVHISGKKLPQGLIASIGFQINF